MNIAHRDKIVVLGFLSHFPFAGVAWQTLHYLVGFQRLGYDVYYVEAHGCAPGKLMQSEVDDGPARAATYIAEIMRRFDLNDRWAYHSLYPEARYFGMSETQLRDLYRSAALIINLHGSHLPTPELTATNRLVYLETDPVAIQVALDQQHQETVDYLAPHCAFFTYGENLGNSDCLVPAPQRFKFLPTRQPVVMDFWDNHGPGDATTFTTIGNWRQPWREVKFKGEVYRWSKHFEFHKLIDLPGRVRQPFELALSSYTGDDQRILESKGWRVRRALDFSCDLNAYRRYIAESRGEFTVAKDQNVRLRSGWFSDRAATYLAAGRPVITQQTGFSNILPTGEGLFAFSSMEEIVLAVEATNADYDRHRRAAWTIAREYFSHEVVLTRLLRDLGISTSPGRQHLEPKSEPAAGLTSSAGVSLGDVSGGGTPPESAAEDGGAPIERRFIETTRRQFALVSRSAPIQGGEVRGEENPWRGPEVLSREPPFCAPAPSPLPHALVLTPTSRWPTRLPEDTVQTALALPTPAAARGCPEPQRACADAFDREGVFQPKELADDGIRAPAGKRASIIIVTHNGLLYTKMCLASLLLNFWEPEDELIIVDNASTDNTPDYLRDLKRLNPFVRLLLNEHNCGFAMANNQGLAQATGDVLILLNNDTILPRGWRDPLLGWLDDPIIGMVGPVTNRTCNEAQIDAPYRTYAELEQFACDHMQKHSGEGSDIGMLAMFCVAMRREVFERVGSLDEQFEVGMFEDDDYARRLRQAGFKIVCAEDVFVHHFGQASMGELCGSGDYDRVLEANRRRFEEKWGITWQPHARRITPEYQRLRIRIQETVARRLPSGATVIVVSKGDEELLRLNGQRGWHFPQADDGQYANMYPADSAGAISHLEKLRAKGAGFLLIPKPAVWWLDHYGEFKEHLERHYRLAVRDEEACQIFDLGGANG